MKRKLICIPILLLIALLNTIGQDAAITNLPPDFTKMLSYREMNAALNAVEDLKPTATPEYVSNLVFQIKQENASDEAKVYAVFLLGKLGATNADAIKILIDKIDLKAPPQIALRLPPWGQYPAEEALIKVGQPVIEPILNHLPKETNELRRQLMCDVLKQVLRNK
jgi:hypothetical protein